MSDQGHIGYLENIQQVPELACNTLQTVLGQLFRCILIMHHYPNAQQKVKNGEGLLPISLIRLSNNLVVESVPHRVSISEAVDGDDSVAFFGKDLDLVAPTVPEIRESVDQEEHRVGWVAFLHKVFFFGGGVK